MIGSVALLLRRRPTWVRLVQAFSEAAIVEAQPAQESGRLTAPYKLRVFSNAGTIEVRETAGGQLPIFCPERHINEDGTFCIGYQAGKGINTEKAADRWWEILKVHLLCQDTATRTRAWPSCAALSHGPAGETQIISEGIAEQRGMSGAVKSALQHKGPIHEALNLISKHKPYLINGRAPCICCVTTKAGKPFLRRVCNLNPGKCLVLLESRRRQQEKEFWESLRNRACCMSMDGCPLAS